MSELSDSVRGSWSFCRDVVSRCRMLLWSSTMTHNRGMKPKCCVQSPFSLPTSVGLDRYLADSLVPAGFYISSLRLNKSCNLAEWVTSSTEDVFCSFSPNKCYIIFQFYLFFRIGLSFTYSDAEERSKKKNLKSLTDAQEKPFSDFYYCRCSLKNNV